MNMGFALGVMLGLTGLLLLIFAIVGALIGIDNN